MHINNPWSVRALLAALTFVIGFGFTPEAFGQHHRRHGHTPVVAQVVSATSPGAQTAAMCSLSRHDVSRARHGGARALRRRNYPLCISSYAVVVTANCAEAADRYNLSFCYGVVGQLRESLEQLQWLQTHNQRPEDVTADELAEAITNLEARLPRQPATTPPVEPPTQTPPVACTAGLVDCYGTCRDLATDASDCGACGVVCPIGQACQRGACQPPVLQRVVDVRQPPPPRQTPVTPPPSRAGGVALITGGAAVAAAGAVILTLGFINQNQDEGDRMRLAMNGCSVASNSPTCVRYAPGATLPGDLAGWQIPLGATTLGIGIAATVVGVVLVTRHPQQPPRARPTVTLMTGGFSLGFTGTF